MLRITALLLGLTLIGSTMAVPAHAESRESTAQEVTYGAGSFFGKVASKACGGTWVITPSALKGKEQVRFVGQ